LFTVVHSFSTATVKTGFATSGCSGCHSCKSASERLCYSTRNWSIPGLICQPWQRHVMRP
jgi:hypothetical protein